MATALNITQNRLKYLIYLEQSHGRECSVTQMAQLFGVNKSTVSRTIEYFKKSGVLFEGTMKLTGYGQKLVDEYRENRNRLALWLSERFGVPEEIAREDAVNILVSVSDTTCEALMRETARNNLHANLRENKKISGHTLCAMLDDGMYPVPYTFYRRQSAGDHYISMANAGFVHPCMLEVKNGNGVIRLKAQKVQNESRLGGLLLSGRAGSVKYLAGRHFAPATRDGDTYFFPASYIQFTYSKEEDILQGSTMLRMTCTVGEMHMPESAAVFTLLL